MINKIVGYRKMIGMSQKEMAEKFNISIQSYSKKENGLVPFKDTEKVIFKSLLLPYFPKITIDDIFFDNELRYVELKEASK
ncbi:helix-turn-helix transcriptional regulator [Staphylococcus hominis]|uniref:helix-turn-helix transcriptional regulator n=1 Tax=Staphylococcus hominis TaxID=1290 RepID=UPI0026E02654|nr:helix-turn-helix domain-containing protein [Staphylococcus hominis]